jgi:hypothetical protein
MTLRRQGLWLVNRERGHEEHKEAFVKARFWNVRAIAMVIGIWLIATPPIAAHEVTYQGTVLAVEPARVQVKTIDEKTKQEDDVWFVVDKDTKVKRGDKTVRYADAKITKGERIALIVNHDASTKMLATEIRLGAGK